jgi:uncharacterized protein (TIGR02611 family)
MPAEGAPEGRQHDGPTPRIKFEPRPPKWLRPLRDRVRGVPGGPLIWKIAIGLTGLLIVALGALLIPLPGPGWAVVFLGLAAWATEFAWAHRLLGRARRILSEWTAHARRQSLVVRLLLGLAGLVFLVAGAYVGFRLLR